MTAFSYTWIDAGRKAQNPPNPKYPMGIDLDATDGVKKFCRTSLPYPASGCGQHVLVCKVCRQRVVITAAGRVDDPRSVKIGCKDSVN